MLPISSCFFSQVLVWMLFTVVHRPLFCLQPTSAPPQWSFVSYTWMQDSNLHSSVTLFYCLPGVWEWILIIVLHDYRSTVKRCHLIEWVGARCWSFWACFQGLWILSLITSSSLCGLSIVSPGERIFSKPNKGESLDQTSLDYTKPWWSYHRWDICSCSLQKGAITVQSVWRILEEDMFVPISSNFIECVKFIEWVNIIPRKVLPCLWTCAGSGGFSQAAH